jgi:toxin ParE1/3/4
LKNPIHFRPEATADVSDIFAYYESKQTGLGSRFTRELDDLLIRISANPALYGRYRSNIRAGNVRKFPYIVYYRLLDEKIEILAILHGRRDRKVLIDRI